MVLMWDTLLNREIRKFYYLEGAFFFRSGGSWRGGGLLYICRNAPSPLPLPRGLSGATFNIGVETFGRMMIGLPFDHQV